MMTFYSHSYKYVLCPFRDSLMELLGDSQMVSPMTELSKFHAMYSGICLVVKLMMSNVLSYPLALRGMFIN